MRAATDSWSPADIPDQAGRTILVTGTTVGGLGQFTALELARRGARVVLTGRRAERIAETRAAILAEVPHAELEPLVVDLADLASVRRAAAEAARTRPDRRAGEQRRRDGHAAPAHPRRPRAPAGDQPLRAVPAHRAAAAAAGRQRGRGRGDGLVADAPGRAARRRSPTRGSSAAATSAGRPTGSPSSRTCCSPTSSTAGPAAPGCRSRRWPRTPASRRPTSPRTDSTAAPPAAAPRSSTRRSRRSRPTPPSRAPGRR